MEAGWGTIVMLSGMSTRVAGMRARTHDPFAMQKVVGSSPIIRFTKAPLSGVFVS
jgi:hypothetical protein